MTSKEFGVAKTLNVSRLCTYSVVEDPERDFSLR